jgi:membrane-bound lytic murein transglycosylase F
MDHRSDRDIPLPPASHRRLSKRRGVRPWPVLVCLLLAAGCQPVEEERAYPTAALPSPTVARPAVERDLEEIKAEGVIRMVTRYNSSSYFIHKGGEAGFEYELFSRFARRQGLSVEVVIPEQGEDLISLLNSGRGDVIAAGLSSTERLAPYVAFTRPYNFVHKVLVLPATSGRPPTLAALAGLTVYLPHHSPFREELRQIGRRQGLQFFIAHARPLVEPEELIAQVASGEIPATVADDDVAAAALSYLPGITLGPRLGEERPVAWAVRLNSPELKAALNAFLKRHFWMSPDGPRRSEFYGTLYERYYRDANQIREFRQPDDRPDKSGRISPYDDLIRATAAAAGLDWRLVAALTYQESRFDPRAISRAGAMGLMQVLPRFAEESAEDLLDPATNIRVGVSLLKEIYGSYAYLDSLDRWRFTLATYHAGTGHMADARRLTIDMGKDPNTWENGVAEGLRRKMQRRYYSETRHGFYRGAETVAYVEEILRRYRMYRRLVPEEGQPEVWLPGPFQAGVPAAE